MRTVQKWTFVKPYEGLVPGVDSMILEEEEIPELQDGDVLFEALYLSLDPHISVLLTRGYDIGTTVLGQQIARVAESRNKDFTVGDNYLCAFGWRTHTIFNNKSGHTALGELPDMPTVEKMPDIGQLPLTATVGSLGMPGVTAYMALLDVCEPKPGETVFISCAAGVVGSVAGQIAKLKGCRVIGSAGSEEKLSWLRELGFDEVFNYKTWDLDEALNKYAPNGIDAYLEMVGGKFGRTVLQHMNSSGRVSVVGAIQTYGTNSEIGYDLINIIVKQLKIVGFEAFAPENLRRSEAVTKELISWAKEGKLKTKQIVVDGFAKTSDAFIDFLKGKYHGKVVVKV